MVPSGTEFLGKRLGGYPKVVYAFNQPFNALLTHANTLQPDVDGSVPLGQQAKIQDAVAVEQKDQTWTQG